MADDRFMGRTPEGIHELLRRARKKKSRTAPYKTMAAEAANEDREMEKEARRRRVEIELSGAPRKHMSENYDTRRQWQAIKDRAMRDERWKYLGSSRNRMQNKEGPARDSRKRR